MVDVGKKRFLKSMQELGLVRDLFERNYIDVGNTIKIINTVLIDKDKEKWKSNVFNDDGHINGNKLRTYRLYKSDLQTETYVKLPLRRDHRRILAMFRCGNLPLHTKTGRFANPKIPVEQRTCFHCPQNIENELHFLIECPFYDDLRRKCCTKHSYAILIL